MKQSNFKMSERKQPERISKKRTREMMAKSKPKKFDIIGELLSNYGEMTGRNISRKILSNLDFSTLQQGTIHLRRQHVLGGGRGVPMCRWSKGHST